MNMMESKGTTATLIRGPEEFPSRTDLAGTPVAPEPPLSTDPVVVSMTEPRIVFVGLPPAPETAPHQAPAPEKMAIPRPERRVQIRWDANTGSYRLGLAL